VGVKSVSEQNDRLTHVDPPLSLSQQSQKTLNKKSSKQPRSSQLYLCVFCLLRKSNTYLVSHNKQISSHKRPLQGSQDGCDAGNQRGGNNTNSGEDVFNRVLVLIVLMHPCARGHEM
jgi:hypothetical protein